MYYNASTRSTASFETANTTFSKHLSINIQVLNRPKHDVASAMRQDPLTYVTHVTWSLTCGPHRLWARMSVTQHHLTLRQRNRVPPPYPPNCWSADMLPPMLP
uniref:Uncharacterized protein n=1 Tax=Arundo donax TaxID=35708 RepID=A0A0A9DRK4_ARUDO